MAITHSRTYYSLSVQYRFNTASIPLQYRINVASIPLQLFLIKESERTVAVVLHLHNLSHSPISRLLQSSGLSNSSNQLKTESGRHNVLESSQRIQTQSMDPPPNRLHCSQPRYRPSVMSSVREDAVCDGRRVQRSECQQAWTGESLRSGAEPLPCKGERAMYLSPSASLHKLAHSTM